MRTIATTLFLMIACGAISCFGQHIMPALTLEKNVAGSEYGASIIYQTKSLLSFGAFYQTGLHFKTEGIRTQKNFTGAVLNIPIARSENINFYVQSRFGFVNERFFVITPGVETELHLLGNVWLNVGGGLRMTYPSFMIKISFKI